VLAIITVIALNAIGTGQSTTGCNFDGVKSNIPPSPDGIKITTPTACKKFTATSTGGGSGSGSGDTFTIGVDIGAAVAKYKVEIVGQKYGQIYCQWSENVTVNTTHKDIPCTLSGSEVCDIYDVKAYSCAGFPCTTTKIVKTYTEKGAVEVKNSNCPSSPPPGGGSNSLSVLLDSASADFAKDYGNSANDFLPGDGPDWHWTANLTLTNPKTIDHIDVRLNGTGDYWSTVNNGAWPVVVRKNGSQQNSDYGQQIPANSGAQTFDLYSNKSILTPGTFRITFFFTDGSSLTDDT